MKAQITFKTQKISKETGKTAYLLGFKCEDGVNRKAWVDEGFKNFTRWEGKMLVGMTLDNLIVYKDTMIDADSFPAVVGMPETRTESSETLSEPETAKDPETMEMFVIEPVIKPQRKLDNSDHA